MARTFLALGALLGFLGVAAGAFGGHALKSRLPLDLQQIFEIGVRYHVYHCLALLLVGILALRLESTALAVAGWLFLFGVVVFSGSLYLLALTGTRWLGAITPFGGTALLAGWLCLAWAAWTATAK